VCSSDLWGYKLLAGALDEDAPRLAGSPAKTNSQGAKNLDAYGSVGFTKAPNAEEAGKQMKGIDVDMLWKEALEESRAYSQFKREAAMRSKPDQLHQAAKMIQHKLQEVEKLLEFTSQMRNDLSEGEATVEYKHNTKKVFERIHSKVVEVYTKVKGLK
jgi:vacuolar-type H+-ATPase catalytic subunit A/Vma1